MPQHTVFHTKDSFPSIDVEKELPHIFNRVPEFKRPLFKTVNVWLRPHHDMTEDKVGGFLSGYKHYDDVVYIVQKLPGSTSCRVYRLDFGASANESPLDGYYTRLIANLKSRYGDDWEEHTCIM